ncbi:MAG: UDP-N-acetylglucosamine 2-epimerase (non-hydrolyzing), partial [Crocinitomicaceae bacterium]|nr:UDP-N-acetylglucosamine 2-epimerase (non-hydrolyzing) [Crocinitomicaceae bacterium]
SYDSLSLELVHTNQHFDDVMSSVFFRQFNIEVDHFLERFEGSPNEHFGHIVQSLDRFFRSSEPDLVIVVGDVNSTLAASLVANRLGIKTAHLESGLRSNDMEMPEEVNRILTDKITNYFFVTENSGLENLRNEGVEDASIFFVGNTMIDTLVHFQDSIEKSSILEELNVNDPYCLVTLHRPSNVDSKEDLEKMLNFFEVLSKEITIVFPMHHRTIRKIKDYGLQERFDQLNNCIICGALDYFSFQKLIANSVIVVTDSGGIQEETTFLQIPCITLRENTERPSTITEGTNQLMSFDSERIIEIIKEKKFKNGSVPKYWDGNATARILEVLNNILVEG